MIAFLRGLSVTGLLVGTLALGNYRIPSEPNVGNPTSYPSAAPLPDLRGVHLYPISKVVAAEQKRGGGTITGVDLMTFQQYNARYVRDRYIRYYIRSDSLVWIVSRSYLGPFEQGRYLPNAQLITVYNARNGIRYESRIISTI